MSAYIVTDYHINALVSFAVRAKACYSVNGNHVYITRENAESVGRILMDANVQSVSHLYGARLSDEEKNAGADYRFAEPNRTFSPVEIIKACHCLDYQSCEVETWRGSVAHAVLQGIKAYAENALPGYDAAPWGLDEERHAAKA